MEQGAFQAMGAGHRVDNLLVTGLSGQAFWRVGAVAAGVVAGAVATACFGDAIRTV
jgi:hypothetical protein